MKLVPDATPEPFEALPPVDAHFQSRASREGALFDEIALEFLEHAGAAVEIRKHEVLGYPLDGRIRTDNGQLLLVAAHGNFDDSSQAGLRRTDTLHKVAHRAAALRHFGAQPMVVVTSHLPKDGTKGAHYLADLHTMLGPWLIDVVATTGDLPGFLRLSRHFRARPVPAEPGAAPWWDTAVQPRLFGSPETEEEY